MSDQARAEADHPRLTLLACQIDIPSTTTAAARDAHLTRTTQEVASRLSRAPCDLVVLPELSSVHYSREAFDCLNEIAEDADGPSFQAWRRVALDYTVPIVFGIPRKTEEGYAISQVVVSADGELIGYFDKIHVAQYGASMEKEYFQRGRHLFVFDINGIRISPIICYDIRIPELTRTLCIDQGADLILHCGAYGRDRSFHSWHAFVATRALENQVHILSLNRAGEDFGASMYSRPWIDEDGGADYFGNGEEFRRFTVDLAEADAARNLYPFRDDRLEDYRGLPSRCPK